MASWSYEFAAVKAPTGLVFTSRPYFDRVISTLGDGEEVIVTVAKPVDKRSLAQNRALWGPIYDAVLDAVADEVGYDRHDKAGKQHLHTGLCLRYGGTVVDPISKLEVQRFHTSKATVKEMSDFIEWIARFMVDEYGVAIALPGEL
jgi:hypothetical protein